MDYRRELPALVVISFTGERSRVAEKIALACIAGQNKPQIRK